MTKAEAERITEEIRRQLWWMDVLTMQGLVMGVAPARLARQLIPPGDFLANQPEARDAWELIITHPRLDGLYAWPAGGHYRTVALEVIAWPEWGDSEDRALVEAARRELGELGELQASPA